MPNHLPKHVFTSTSNAIKSPATSKSKEDSLCRFPADLKLIF